MSKKLAKILDQPESEITRALAKLEERSGYPSEDVRLLAENKHRLRGKIRQLGLDPEDTTDEELFYALRTRYENDSNILDKVLGAGGAKYSERLNKAVQLVQHCAASDEVWVAKAPTIKAMLSKNQPKHTAKILGYRSVASMIKREDVVLVHTIATVAESNTWHKNSSAQLKRLNGSHYEMRRLKILKLENGAWAKYAKPHQYVVADPAVGAVALWPSKDLSSASVLSLTLLLLEGIRTLNSEGYAEALHELSPALRWWANSEYLISDGDIPVSLNIKDVAYNHLNNHGLREAKSHNAAGNLWHELVNRYRKITTSVSVAADGIEDDLDSLPGKKVLPTVNDAAAEYAAMD